MPKKDISGTGDLDEGWQKISEQQLVAASGAGQLLVIMRKDGVACVRRGCSQLQECS